MINKKDLDRIEALLNNKIITDSKLLSSSFGINCIKITIENKFNLIVKYYKYVEENNFNAIKSEAKNLIYLNKLNLKSFPKVYSQNEDYLIMSFFDNNEIKPNYTKDDLLNSIISIHSLHNKEYGFDFDTQIGGLRQKNTKMDNWVEYYKELRLGYIFNLLNKENILDLSLSLKIEKLLNKLENYIPKNPRASLLHGDLWEGNILFKNSNFVGFIDPGTFYGHNELEIAYLTWFNPDFIKNNFLEKYNNIISLDKEYKNYEPIYQLYYSLMNVYLWDRNYIKDSRRLIEYIKN